LTGVLSRIGDRYGREVPLSGKRILLCTHATDATVEFVKTMSGLGAAVIYTPVPYSQSRSSLNKIGKIADRVILLDETDDIQKIIPKTDLIMEDGMRISRLVYGSMQSRRLKNSLYCIEQTTSGIRRFEEMLQDHRCLYPIVNVAESRLKSEIENALVTPEAVMSSFRSKEPFMFAQKNVLILGYGHLGGGLARICRDHGSRVVVVDSDPIRRTLAASRGFIATDVGGMDGMLGVQDLVISCTSNVEGTSLGVEQFLLMKDGAIVFNAGSGRGEVSSRMLEPGASEAHRCRMEIRKRGDDVACVFTKNGGRKTVKILDCAHPINLRSGKGNPSESVDLVFSLMLLVAIKQNPESLRRAISHVDMSLEREAAALLEDCACAAKPRLVRARELVGEQRPWGSLFKLVGGIARLGNLSVVRASFGRNASTDGHYHLSSEEAYIMERGTADIVTWDPKDPDDQNVFKVSPGDILTVSKGRAHRVFVTSDEDFTCLVVASPPFSCWDQFFPTARQRPSA